jgi:predicted DNA-binding protein (UPF0251 family)
LKGLISVKFTTETRERLVDRTIDGVTHQVRQRYTERVPKMPRDWDTLAVKGAAGIVLALTITAIVWSTYSIGDLLGGGIGYAAAVIFDLSWLVVLLVEYLARFDARKRTFPKAIGWVLVGVAASAIFIHGALEGDWALAGIGAAVSVVSKLLWLVVMKFVDREINESDAQWMQQEISGINAKEAIATVRLRAALADERAALRLLQAEQIRHQIDTLRTPDAASAPALETVSHGSAQRVLTATHDEPEAAHEVFTQVSPAGQGEQTAEQIARCEQEVRALTAALRSGRQLTGTQAAELLGVSRSTAQRRLAEARSRVARDGHGGYL